jgi:hypothetical protein
MITPNKPTIQTGKELSSASPADTLPHTQLSHLKITSRFYRGLLLRPNAIPAWRANELQTEKLTAFTAIP